MAQIQKQHASKNTIKLADREGERTQNEKEYLHIEYVLGIYIQDIHQKYVSAL